MNITRETIKETLKNVMAEEADYKVFFKKALEKAGKSIPSMSDEEKKEFFNKIDAAWNAKGEKNEELTGNQHKLDVDGDGEIEASDLAALRAGNKKDESIEESAGCSCGCGGCSESVNELDTKKADMIRKSMPGFVGPEFAKKASDEDILAMADLKDQHAKIYNRYMKDINDKISKLQKKYRIKESINELANAETVDALTAIIGAGGLVGGALALDKLMTALERGKMGSKGKTVAKALRGLGKTFAGAGMKGESTNERMGSDKGEVGNANFNNRLKAMRDDKNSVVAYIDTNKGKKLLKVFKTQQTAQQFKKKNMDKLLNTKGVESVGTMSKKEWDAKEAKYAIK